MIENDNNMYGLLLVTMSMVFFSAKLFWSAKFSIFYRFLAILLTAHSPRKWNDDVLRFNLMHQPCIIYKVSFFQSSKGRVTTL